MTLDSPSSFLNGSSLFRRKQRSTDNYAPPPLPSASTDPGGVRVNSYFDDFEVLLARDAHQTADVYADADVDAASRPTTAFRADALAAAQPAAKESKHRRSSSSLSSLTDFSTHLRRRSTSLRTTRPKSPSYWGFHTPMQTERRTVTGPVTGPRTLPPSNSQPSTDSLASYTSKGGSATDTSYNDSQVSLARDHGNAKNGPTKETARSVSVGSAPLSDVKATVRRVRDVSARRISLMKYLHLVYASETHWFNTHRITPAQIKALPSMQPPRIGRRSHSLMVLGLSIPFFLDPNRDNLTDYLRTFSALLSEFEAYCTLHPLDGSSSSALSRARLPQMFKRGPAKGRRGSSADMLSPQGAADEIRGGINGLPPPSSATWTSFPASTQEDLLAGEDYHYLLTPSLPFEVDYYMTFVTLCDVLGDAYRHMTALVDKQEAALLAADRGGAQAAVLGELFNRIDAKVGKLVLAGIVQEFEDASVAGVRTELASVGRLVMGALVP